MFALVALMCLYLGIRNIRSAFRLAARSGWEKISILLLITGILLVALVIPCVLQANKDLKEKQKKAEELIREEEEKKKLRRDQFFYDDREDLNPPETNEEEIPDDSDKTE